MVIIHFHLKDYIMIGKKKQRDVQFFTEVVDSSLSLEGSKRSSYDPDELDEEQREREMRRRLNMAFKEFCQKLEKVAAHYDYALNIDVPFRKSGFEANVNREMVLIQPTTHALVNLTESPPFVVTIADIEHVHFERAGFTTKAFDIVIIFKDWNVMPKQLTGASACVALCFPALRLTFPSLSLLITRVLQPSTRATWTWCKSG
jgi:nucleosome binding factor SPN SPT16 subunit